MQVNLFLWKGACGRRKWIFLQVLGGGEESLLFAFHESERKQSLPTSGLSLPSKGHRYFHVDVEGCLKAFFGQNGSDLYLSESIFSLIESITKKVCQMSQKNSVPARKKIVDPKPTVQDVLLLCYRVYGCFTLSKTRLPSSNETIFCTRCLFVCQWGGS